MDEYAPLTIGGKANDAAALKSAIVRIMFAPEASMFIASDTYNGSACFFARV